MSIAELAVENAESLERAQSADNEVHRIELEVRATRKDCSDALVIVVLKGCRRTEAELGEEVQSCLRVPRSFVARQINEPRVDKLEDALKTICARTWLVRDHLCRGGVFSGRELSKL